MQFLTEKTLKTLISHMLIVTVYALHVCTFDGYLVNLSVVIIDQTYERFTVEFEDMIVYKQEKGLKQVEETN